MSTHRLMSAAALRGSAAAGALAPALAAAPAAPAAPAPAPAAEGAVTDVVSLADANAAIGEAEVRGATAERNRTAAVFASDEGKAHPQMAAFMLSSNPGATSEAIVAHLKTMPAAAAAPAPAATAAPPAPTADLTLTPKIEVGTQAHSGGQEEMTAADQEKFWSGALASANSPSASPFGGELAPGIPRTGN